MPESVLQRWIPANWENMFATLLEKRGVSSDDDFQHFFAGELADIAPVESLHDMASAVKLIEQAIAKQWPIFIYGDYDADGVCATAVLWEYLYRERGAKVLPFIPSRVEHGYGLHPDAVQELAKQGAKLIITVDCGIRDHELITQWQKKGLQFVVTDHHQPGEVLPDCPVVHPMHPDGDFRNRTTSGTTVAWYLILAMVKAQQGGKLEPGDWQKYGLDLAGLSLVTDLMPLVGDNRTIVRAALQAMRKQPRMGLAALLQGAGVDQSKLEAYHFGFIIGPRLNAAGRIGDPMEAVRLLSTNKEGQSRTLAVALNQLNQQRQELTEQIVNEVGANIKQYRRGNYIMAVGENWNEGIIGLVAGRLQEKYRVPAFVVTVNEREARGSARSTPDINIVDLITRSSKHLRHFGGHAAAAGFSLDPAKVEVWLEVLGELFGERAEYREEKPIETDAELSVSELTVELAELLQLLEPHGLGNPVPKFTVTDGLLQDFRLVGSGQEHLAFRVTDQPGNVVVKAIRFRGADLYTQLEPNQPVTVIGKISLDEWNGNKQVQIIADKVL